MIQWFYVNRNDAFTIPIHTTVANPELSKLMGNFTMESVKLLKGFYFALSIIKVGTSVKMSRFTNVIYYTINKKKCKTREST